MNVLAEIEPDVLTNGTFVKLHLYKTFDGISSRDINEMEISKQ